MLKEDTPIRTLEVTRLDHVGLMVSDLDAAVDWYVGSLGLRVADRWTDADAGMAWAHLETDGLRVELVQRVGLGVAAPNSAGLHHLALVVADCVTATDALAACGAEVVFAPSYFERHDMDWSFVRDPFGNIIELVSYRTTPPRRP